MRLVKRIVKAGIESIGYQISRAPSPRGKQCWPIPHPDAQTFFELDEDFHRLYDRAQTQTQMVESDNPLRRQRNYTLNYLLWAANLELGDVCEVGCWRGSSAYQIASFLKRNHQNKEFHIFDSFQGLSGFDSVDITDATAKSEEEVRRQFSCSLDVVANNLRDFDFIKYYPGWIPGRFSDLQDRSFSFVHVDVDLYQPTYDTFQFFFPRLTKNGIMAFDDYGCAQFPGTKKAVDECIAAIEKPVFIPLPSGLAFLVKGL